MVAVLDILQSIPVLSFLPGVMLAMVALFPTKQVGVELGSIILIFTGQVWNHGFQLLLVAEDRFRANCARRRRSIASANGSVFSSWSFRIGTIGLIWNSIVSVAGGWFFLMACEMFVLGNRDFRLPGLGSCLQTAADNGDTRSMLWGLAAMITRDSSDRPAGLAAGHCMVEQIQVRAGGERRMPPRSPLLHILRNSAPSKPFAKEPSSR